MTIPLHELKRMMEAATKLSPLPWTITEDSIPGKEEAWCHWHRVGPFSMTGKDAHDDDRLVIAAINALPSLIAVCEAAMDPALQSSTAPFGSVPHLAQLKLREALAPFQSKEK